MGIVLLCYSWTAQCSRIKIGAWFQPIGSIKPITWKTILSTCSLGGIDHLCWGSRLLVRGAESDICWLVGCFRTAVAVSRRGLWIVPFAWISAPLLSANGSIHRVLALSNQILSPYILNICSHWSFWREGESTNTWNYTYTCYSVLRDDFAQTILYIKKLTHWYRGKLLKCSAANLQNCN